MAVRGGQPENKNAQSKRPWQAAIKRALEKRTAFSRVEALDELAEKLLVACEMGELEALKELGNRLDGKPAQSVELSQDPNNPLFEMSADDRFSEYQRILEAVRGRSSTINKSAQGPGQTH